MHITEPLMKHKALIPYIIAERIIPFWQQTADSKTVAPIAKPT